MKDTTNKAKKWFGERIIRKATPIVSNTKVIKLPKNRKQKYKLFLWNLQNLSKKQGWAFCTNKYLAKRFEVTTRTIQNWIKKALLEGHLILKTQIGQITAQRLIALTEEGKKFIGFLSGGGEKKGGNRNNNIKTRGNKDLLKSESELKADKYNFSKNWKVAKKLGVSYSTFCAFWNYYERRKWVNKKGKKVYNPLGILKKFWAHKEIQAFAQGITDYLRKKPAMSNQEIEAKQEKVREYWRFYRETLKEVLPKTDKIYLKAELKAHYNRYLKSVSSYLSELQAVRPEWVGKAKDPNYFFQGFA
jgi:transposase